jgi:ribonuclease P protein component
MSSLLSLSGRTRFSQVFADGRRAGSDGLTVWVLPQPEATAVRLGLAVGTHAGGAVDRNRIRRRVRALVRGFNLDPCSLVVRADGGAVRLPFQELERHLSAALRRAGMTPS